MDVTSTPDRGVYRGLTEGQKENRMNAWHRAAGLCALIARIDQVRQRVQTLCVASSGEREIRRLKKEIEEVIRSAYDPEPAPAPPTEPTVFKVLRRIDWDLARTNDEAFLITSGGVFRFEARSQFTDMVDGSLWDVDFDSRQLEPVGQERPARDLPSRMFVRPPAKASPPDESLPALEALIEKLKPLLAPTVELQGYSNNCITFSGPKGNHTFWATFLLDQKLNAWGNELAAKDFLRERGWLLEAAPATANTLKTIAEGSPPTLDSLTDFVDELRNGLGLDEYVVHLFHAGPASSQASEIVVHRFAVNARNEMACEIVAAFPFETLTQELWRTIVTTLEAKTGKVLHTLRRPFAAPAPLTHDGQPEFTEDAYLRAIDRLNTMSDEQIGEVLARPKTPPDGQPEDDGMVGRRLTDEQRKNLEASGMLMSEAELLAQLDQGASDPREPDPLKRYAVEPNGALRELQPGEQWPAMATIDARRSELKQAAPMPSCPPVQAEPDDRPDTPWRGISPTHMNALLAHVRQNWQVVEKGCGWEKTNAAGLAAEIKIMRPDGGISYFYVDRDRRPEDHSTYEALETFLTACGLRRRGEVTQ